VPDLQQRGLHDAVTRHPLVEAACGLARDLLGGLDGRWRHTQGVATRAARVAPAVPAADRPVLVAAAWLHDIDYAQPLRRSTFHPLDGAWYLQQSHWPKPLAGLVAHHWAARFVAEVRSLTGLMLTLSGHPLRGRPGRRRADLRRSNHRSRRTGHGHQGPARRDAAPARPDSPNARAHAQRAPDIRAAVRRTEQRLHRPH
jgi:hypothetical protein